MKTLLLISIFFSITAWGIIPAKEALKETKIVQKTIKQDDDKEYKKCTKKLQHYVDSLIDQSIKEGSCWANIQQSLIGCFNQKSRITTFQEDAEVTFKPFKDAGYKVTINNTDIYNLSWCDAK
jgi:hypothetical protein